MMIFARVLQGFGGGGLLPVAQAVLLESFPKDMRGKAMASFGLVVVLAPIIGPVAGGWITDNWNWPWVFLINLPIGLLTLFLANELLEDPPYAKKQKDVKIDGKGFLFLTIWLVSLQVVLDKGNNADWFNSPWICQLTFVMAISAILFIWSQLTNKNSLVDLSIFKDRNYAAGTLMQVVIQAVLLASLAILPQFLQILMGYTAYLSGLSIMPRGVGALCAMIFYAVLSNKVDNRFLAGLGLFLIGVAGWSLGNLNLQISSMNIAIPNFIFGLGMGFAMIPLIELSVVTLKNSQMTNASGIQNLLKNISGAIGTSVVATLITRFSQIHQANLVGNLNSLNPVFVAKLNATTGALAQYTHPVTANYMAQYALYGELVKQSTLWGFIEAFRIFGIALFLVIPLLFLLKKVKDN
jgi:DHA2 family multidrug resistance protein